MVEEDIKRKAIHNTVIHAAAQACNKTEEDQQSGTLQEARQHKICIACKAGKR